MFRKRRPDDFASEIQSHLELETERLIADGLSPDEARRIARRKFGSVTVARERFHESQRLPWLDHLALDVRTAARVLKRYPIACAVAVLSLGGGIGATTATLAVRDTVFYKAPPLYRDPARLSRVDTGTPTRLRQPVPAAVYRRWADDPELAPGLAAVGAARGFVGDVRAGDRLATIPIRFATPELFDVLGVAPALGRTFATAATSASERTPVVLSHLAWQTLFDGRSDALGRDIRIGTQSYVVVGVLPERFWFGAMDGPIWTPLDVRSLAPDDGLDVVIRRAAGVNPGDLGARLQRDAEHYASSLPADRRQLRVQVRHIGGAPVAQQVALIVPWLLGAAVLLTLLIACANVAILAIAQWTSREHEIAIRASLGAGRGRIVRLLVTESVLIASLGGALGICATFALRGWIASGSDRLLRFLDLSIDPLVLVQSAFVTILSGLVAGLGPALLETRRLHGNPIRSVSSSDRVRQRWRHTLVVMEISVTVALLVVASALVDGYRRSFSTPLGIDTRELMAAHVQQPAGVPAARIAEALAAVPRVVAVGTATSAFGSGDPETVATDAGSSHAVAARRVVMDRGYFQAIGARMRLGRSFSAADVSSGSDAAIVNELLAKRLFGGVRDGASPSAVPLPESVGSYIWIAKRPRRIVGVVADYATTALQRIQPSLFLPLTADASETRLQFVIRAAGDTGTLPNVVRQEIRAASPAAQITATYSLDALMAAGAQEILASTYPLIPLITIGILLTAAGIYGVLAFAITRRSRELAVRVAIGASHADLVRLVSAHSARLLVAGTAVGVGVTFALTRVVRVAGGEGTILDAGWQSFAAPVAIIAIVGALATWLPSRRVLKIDPATLLRMN